MVTSADPRLVLVAKLAAERVDGAGALVTIREAVAIRRLLAQDNPALFGPELTQSLKILEALQADRP